MTVHVDCSKARARMKARARSVRDVASRPLEQAAADAAKTAAATTAWKDKSGGTRASIRPMNGPGAGRSSAIAKGAAVFLEAGTGRYGLRGRDYVITPKNGRYLSFVIGGRRIFTSHVVHRGIKPTHFMHRAAEEVRPRFIEACVRSLQRVVAHP